MAKGRPNHGGGRLLDAKPLQEILAVRLHRMDRYTLARHLGVDEGSIRRVMTGTQVTLDLADRLCIELGYTFSMVYGWEA